MDSIERRDSQATSSTTPITKTTSAEVAQSAKTSSIEVATATISTVANLQSTPPSFDSTVLRLSFNKEKYKSSQSKRVSPSDEINPGSTGDTLWKAVLSPLKEDGTLKTIAVPHNNPSAK